MALYVIDTGRNFDRPVQKGQWTVSDIPNGGVKILNTWLKERADGLVKELHYAKLEGTGKIEVKPLSEDFDVEIVVNVKIRPAKRKAQAQEGKVERRAQR